MKRHAAIMSTIMTTIISGQIHQNDQSAHMNQGPYGGTGCC